MIKCSVGHSRPIEFLIDSGADVNVLCGKDWDELKQEAENGTATFESTERSIRPNVCSYATKRPMTVEQEINALVQVVGYDGPGLCANFIVIRDGRRSLLGRSTASDLGLLAVGLAVSSCEQTLRSRAFPKMPGVVVKFSIDKTVPPVRNAYFNVPAAFRKAAMDRLADMEERDIIERVTTAPNWISGMSAVPKGKKRLPFGGQHACCK